MDWFKRAVERAGGEEQVAERSGVSITHIRNLLNGHRFITPKMVLRLSPVLRVSRKRWLEAVMARAAHKPTLNPASSQQQDPDVAGASPDEAV